MVRPLIFVSHKRDHPPTTEMLGRIETALPADRYEVVYDTQIEAGARWSGELYRWLLGCSAAVVLVSEEAAQSEWCRRE